MERYGAAINTTGSPDILQQSPLGHLSEMLKSQGTRPALSCVLACQGHQGAGGFQTARTALAAELRKTGRQLPLQLKNAQQESEARQGKGAQKKGAGSAAAMFPEGQGAFNSTAAPRQGLLRSKGSRQPNAQGGLMVTLTVIGPVQHKDSLLGNVLHVALAL